MSNAARRDASPVECSGTFATGCQVLWIQRLVPSGQFVDDRLTRQACRLTKTAIDIALPGAHFEKRDARADERDDEPDKERQRDAERPQLVPR